MNLEWNVYRENVNARKIEVFNVFKHGGFKVDVLKLLKEKITFEEFSEQLRRTAQYFYWSKCEWEIIITGFPEKIKNDELEFCKKIDVYNQLMLNWTAFTEYVWSFKEK